MAIEKPKRYKSPGIYQIPVELIKAGSRTIHSRVTGENYVMGNLNVLYTPIICDEINQGR
jgi:hypothetical protein